MPPPCREDAGWYWPAKIVPGDRPADLLEHFTRLALGM
jgi:hypothetical protein